MLIDLGQPTSKGIDDPSTLVRELMILENLIDLSRHGLGIES